MAQMTFFIKRALLSMLMLIATGTAAWAEGETAYAVWCADNTTLYFLGSEASLTAGGTFTPEGATDPVTITNVWSGTAVTATSPTGTPGWNNSTIKNNMTHLVFESSFAGFTPTSLRGWFYQSYKLTTVEGIANLNTSAATRMDYMFQNCSLLTSLDLHTFDTGNVLNMEYMFGSCAKLESLNLNGWSNTNVTNMYAMMYNCPLLNSVNLNGFNTSAVQNMSYMFSDDKALATVDVSGFVTTSATNLSYMFKNCTGLTGLDLSNFNTALVTTTQEMFSGCTKLQSLDLSGWANTKLTNMSKMFYNCEKLSTLTLTGFQTPAATSFNSMFAYCKALEGIGLSGWNTEKVTDMQYMFYGCIALQNIDLSNWNTGALSNAYQMFYGCTALTTIDLSSFNTSALTNTSQMFYGCTALTTVNLSGWANPKLSNMSSMFYGCTSLTSPIFTGFNTSAVTNMNSMFYNCTALTSIDLTAFNTAALTNIGSMFRGCSNLQRVNLSGWTNAKVTDMSYLFSGCERLATLDLTGFATPAATNMSYMFQNCKALTSIDLSGFTTASVTNMGYMFLNCQELSSLDLSSFNTAKVTNMNQMFDGCSALESIYVSLAWTTALVNSSSNMFRSCTSLVGQDGTTLTTYNPQSLDRTHATDEAGGYLKTGTTTDLEEPLAYAIWCADNATLYYINSTKQLVSGRSFTPAGSETPVSMTTVWNGTQVTSTGSSNPAWYNTVKATLQYVVFEPSFADVAPTSLCAWFRDCVNLTDVTGFNYLNTANVTNMSYMFSGATAIQGIDLSGLSTANVTAMQYMFYNCTSLQSLTLTGLNTEKVTNMSYMFQNCAALTTLDLSSFNTLKVSDMRSMFSGCSNLASIYVGSYWAVGQITNANNHANMFSGCSAIVGEDGTTYTASAVDKTKAHYGTGGYLRLGTETTADEEVYAVWCADNATLYFLKTDKPLFRYGLFRPAGTSEVLSITNIWSGTQVTATSTNGTPGWQSTVKSTMTTAVFEPSFADVTLTSLRGWFYQCPKLTSIAGISNLNTLATVNMAYMFSGCTLLGNLDLSTFNTANVTTMEQMFSNCPALATVNVLGFNTEQVTNMNSMFNGCSSLTELDLTSFSHSGSGTVSRGGMFQNCTNLVSIYVIDMGVTSNTGSGIFSGCTSIVGESGITYNSSLTGSSMMNYDTGYLRNGRSARAVWCSDTGTLYFTTINRNLMPQSGDTFTTEDGEQLTITAIWSADEVSNIGNALPGWSSVGSSVQQVVIEPCFRYVRATSLYGWFEGFSNITAISGIEHLKGSTASATTMSRMFKDCTALTDLDISCFETVNVTDMSQMFSGCSQLVRIQADSGWSTESVTASADMFAGCTSIVGQDGTTYDGSSVDAIKAHYGTGGYLRGVMHPYVVLCKDDTTSSNSTLYFLTATNLFADATTYTPAGSDTPRAITAKWSEEEMGDADNNPVWVNDDSARPYIYHVVFEPSFASVRPISMRAWFYRCSNLKDLSGLENLNTSQVTTMFALFDRCTNLVTLDLSMLDVSNVTNMELVFEDCYQLESINMAGWNTANVTNMNHMFGSSDYSDYALKSLDLSSFDTHNVTDMNYMFDNRRGLVTIYVGEGWNVENVTYMGGYAMFNRCNSLVGQDGTTYYNQNISADYAHYGEGGYLTLKPAQGAYALWCSESSTLYFTYSGNSYAAGGSFTPEGSTTPQRITAVWYDKEVTHTGDSRYSSYVSPKWLSTIIPDDDHTLLHVVFEPSFANVAVTTTRYWFSSLSDLQDITGMEYLNTSLVTDMQNMFSFCSSLTSLDLSHLNTDNVTNMSGMFSGCSALQTLDVSGFNTEHVTNMASMFGCYALTTLDLSNFDTRNVTDMGYMFDGCRNLTTVNLSSFTTDNVTTMAYMFADCTALTALNLSTFNTAKVTTMFNMFRGCSLLQNLDLSGFETGLVTDMREMFRDCSSLQSLDLSDFNTSNVLSMDFMFLGCQNLQQLDLSSFNTAKVTSFRATFSRCTALTQLDLASFNTAQANNMYYMFNGCTNLQTIFISDGWSTESLKENVYTGDAVLNGKEGLFNNCPAIVGESGTAFDSNYINADRANADDGYLTYQSVTVTLPSSGVGTFSAPFKVVIPQGLKAYIAPDYEGDESFMMLYEVEPTTIELTDHVVAPANTGYLLRGEPGVTFKLVRTVKSDEGARTMSTFEHNMLVPVIEAAHIAPIDGDNACFTLDDGKFNRVEADGIDMPANTAILQIPTTVVQGVNTVWLEALDNLAGDANGDGAVTIADVTAIIGYLTGNPPADFNKKNANVDGDLDATGEPNITITDAQRVVNLILNKL